MVGKEIEPTEENLRRILEPFGDADPYYRLCVEHLLDIGRLTLRRDWIPRKEVPEAWARAHKLHQSGSGEEISHLKGKVRGAEYLSRRGHSLDKTPLPESKGGHLFAYQNFERAASGFQADVLCSCDDCATAVEIGYTPPERLLSAFGYTGAKNNMEAAVEYDEENPYCVRTRTNYKDGFFVLPYTGLSDEKDGRTYVYRFEPTDSIPEPDMSYLRDRGEEILDG